MILNYERGTRRLLVLSGSTTSIKGISMPKKTVQSFSVEWLQILDENGNCDEALRPSLSNDEIKKLYEWMLLARIFDEKAFKLKGDKIAVMAYMGDGATSKGDFHEGLNFAGVFAVPVVFVCQNNQWAISVPLKRQTAAKTLAQKAIAYGFSGIQVDGNDPFAVYKATHEALDQARDGQGPTLIECVTYRLGDHTTADDASR